MSRQLETAVDVGTIISRDPEVHSGDLVFAGTRVPAKTIVDYLKGGYSLDEFLENFPTVERWQAEGFLDLAPDALERMRAPRAPSP